MKSIYLKYIVGLVLIFSFFSNPTLGFFKSYDSSLQSMGLCDAIEASSSTSLFSLSVNTILSSTPQFGDEPSINWIVEDEPEEPPCICDGCVGGSCTLPSCPCGTTVNTGIHCRCTIVSCSWIGSCSGCGCPPPPTGMRFRGCYHPENAPAPSAPQDIRITSPRSCILTSDTRRMFYSGSVTFRGNNATNNRSGDSLGRPPDLFYPSKTIGVSQGQTYTADPVARSLNRCRNRTTGPSVTGDFTVNWVPEVISIEPVEPHPNRGDHPDWGVSGRIDSANANYLEETYGCEPDNPKTFKVVFRDRDGCGDIWNGASADTNICGGTRNRNMYLRAVRSGTNSQFSISSNPYDVSCSGNQVTAYFDLEFTGSSVLHLDLQAKADDIVGNTSGWVKPSSGVPHWSYDGAGPSFNIDVQEIIAARELLVQWEVEDDTNNMSGIRGIRMFAELDKGQVFLNDDEYGSIVYTEFETDEREVEKESRTVNVDSWDEELAWEEFRDIVEARQTTALSSGERHHVDVGINQDGNLHFRIEAVDGACNLNHQSDTLELGTPWIATRGGFVHSEGGFDLATKRATYGNLAFDISADSFSIPSGEQTSLSTELLTIGSGSIPNLGSNQIFYRLVGYDKQLNKGWYDELWARANVRDPNGEMWTLVDSSNGNSVSVEGTDGSVDAFVLTESELRDNCRDSQHAYFIDGNLLVNEEGRPYYENIGRDGVNGCIFVVSGNMIIDEGVWKSGGQ